MVVKRREIIYVTYRRKKMRRKVREMEAFGWALDDYEEAPKKMVTMRFWRPMDIHNREKVRKLEFAFSRLPGEESILNLKTTIGLLLCLFIASLVWSLTSSFYFVLYAFGIGVLVLAWLLDNDAKRFSRRRDMLLEHARLLTSVVESTERSVEKVQDDEI